MYTRIVTFTAQPHHHDKILQVFNEQIVPALRKQAGFVDFSVLEDKDDRNRFLSVTYWNTPQDADRYHNDQYPKLRGLLDPYMTVPAELRQYHVEISTSHGIAAGKAA
jgi:heme-degrading monooxygenase HmoA